MKNITTEYKNIALVLQGGGALGSYQAGVIAGLENAGIRPNWIAGVSIGSLNCAIIAGNAAKDRIQKLHEFWTTICSPPSLISEMILQSASFLNQQKNALDSFHESFAGSVLGSLAASETLLSGQKGFFLPKPLAPGIGMPNEISYYDTSPLIKTLEHLCDFDRINSSKEIRVSIEATNLNTGNYVYFDNTSTKLRPEHFLASGALPPGFPAVEIDGEYYWDGGCVSNTPLEYILQHEPRYNTLIFQVDLWSAKGSLPKTLFEVIERQKEIQFSSRTRSITDQIGKLQELRQLVSDIVARIPEEVKKQDSWYEKTVQSIYEARFNCIQLIYQHKPHESYFKDYQFSNATMNLHWQAGLRDIELTINNPDNFALPPQGHNFITHDIHRLTSALSNEIHNPINK